MGERHFPRYQALTPFYSLARYPRYKREQVSWLPPPLDSSRNNRVCQAHDFIASLGFTEVTGSIHVHLIAPSPLKTCTGEYPRSSRLNTQSSPHTAISCWMN